MSDAGATSQTNDDHRTKKAGKKRPRSVDKRTGTLDNHPSSPLPQLKNAHLTTGYGYSYGPFGRCSDVSQRYAKLDRIGEGTYGIVYRARDKLTNEIVALKRCLPHHESTDGFPLTTLRELTLLREFALDHHPNIVLLRDVAVSSHRSGVFLVFDYAEHDLANLIDVHYDRNACSPFKESEVKRLLLQLLSALAYLHSRHVLHRDLKLSNLLYTHSGELRLADFGLARKVSLRTACPQTNTDDDGTTCRTILTPKVVSLWYRPPEILFGSETYDEGCDNWGAGCVFAELLTGVPLNKGQNELEQVSNMFELLGPPDSKTWPELDTLPLIQNGSVTIPSRTHGHGFRRPTTGKGKSLSDRLHQLSPEGFQLVSSFLTYNSKRRISAKDASRSKYFQEMPFPTNRTLMPTFPTLHNKPR